MQAPHYYTDHDCIQPYSTRMGDPSHFAGRRERRTWLRGASNHILGALLLTVAMLGQPLAALMMPAVPSSQAAATSEARPSTGSLAGSQYFSSTGKSVRGGFLNTFRRFGLETIGYPLSSEQTENGLTVQYFERVRMEHHPEAAARGYAVLMSRLGVDLSKHAPASAKAAPFKSTKSSVYVGETGHSLSEPFLSYWRTKGGVEIFGYPITEPLVQDGLKVQWFERARFEYHPELAGKGQPVQLSLLGRAAYEKAGALPAANAPQQAAPKVSAQPVEQAPAAQQPASKQPALTAMEADLLKRINEQRAAARLAPMELSSAAIGLARDRSADMAERNYFSHTTPEGTKFLSMLVDRGVSYKYAGEILARNNYPDAEAAPVAMNSYLNSPPHKAIIMEGRYNRVGVGYARSGEDAMHYFTVIFLEQ